VQAFQVTVKQLALLRQALMLSGVNRKQFYITRAVNHWRPFSIPQLKTPGFDTGGSWHVLTAIVFILPDPGGLVCRIFTRLGRL